MSVLPLCHCGPKNIALKKTAINDICDSYAELTYSWVLVIYFYPYQLLKDTQLLLLIGGLLVVDSVVMCLWIVIDPMDREVYNLSARPSEEDLDLLYIPQLSKCNCSHLQKWMGSLYAYKVSWFELKCLQQT